MARNTTSVLGVVCCVLFTTKTRNKVIIPLSEGVVKSSELFNAAMDDLARVPPVPLPDNAVVHPLFEGVVYIDRVTMLPMCSTRYVPIRCFEMPVRTMNAFVDMLSIMMHCYNVQNEAVHVATACFSVHRLLSAGAMAEYVGMNVFGTSLASICAKLSGARLSKECANVPGYQRLRVVHDILDFMNK